MGRRRTAVVARRIAPEKATEGRRKEGVGCRVSGDGRRACVEFESLILQTSVTDLREWEDDTRGEDEFRIGDFGFRAKTNPQGN